MKGRIHVRAERGRGAPWRLIVSRFARQAVVCLGCAGLLVLAPHSGRAQPPAASPVEVAPVIAKSIAGGATFVGSVMPNRSSIVGSAVDGRVVEVFVEEGDRVAKDQPLAQILTKTLEIEIAGARAELDLRTQELKEMRNGSREEEKAQARAEIASATATLEFARSRLARAQSLARGGGGSITQEELDEARSVATAAEQRVVAVQAAYDLVMKGPRDERVLQAEARENAAREAVNLLEDRLKKYTLRAPFDGYVVAKHTEAGAWVKTADPVADVVELDPVIIRVPVLELYIANLWSTWNAAAEAQGEVSAQVTVEAVPQAFTGVVESIVPQADLRSRTFPVRVRVPNPKNGRIHPLQAGMLARVTLPVGQLQNGLLVPKDSLVLGGATPVVFVVDGIDSGRSVVRAVPVQLGVADGDLIQVTGALRAGESVVVRGNERLRNGQDVKVGR